MNTARIIWLSDIHYCHNNALFAEKINSQQRKTKIEKYFESIKDKILELSPTHILITGDLAFSGLYKDMEDMYNVILKEYMEDAPSTRLIICCGNHECDRRFLLSDEAIAYLKSHLESIGVDDVKKLGYQDRKKVLHALRDIKLKDELQQVIRNIDTDILTRIVTAPTNRFNYEDLLFAGYKKFWETHVESRFNAINEMSPNTIQTWYVNHADNKGLYGVVLDVEYDLIFSIVNTSWMAWGKSTYERALGNIWTEQGDEYGNLTVDMPTIKKIRAVIKDLDDRGYNKSSNLICLQHHSHAFIAYEEQYRNAINFNHFYSNQDMILTGHNHVPHFKASRFRGDTLYFEAPQIFDYHLYSTPDTDATGFFEYASKNHGFSTFEVNRDHRSIAKRAYLLGQECSFIDTECNVFSWVEKEEYYEKFHFEKTHIKNVFDLEFKNGKSPAENNAKCLDTFTSYLRLWKEEVTPTIAAEGDQFKLYKSEISLDLDKLVIDIDPTMKRQNSINDLPTKGFSAFKNEDSVFFLVEKINKNEEARILQEIMKFALNNNIKIIKLLYADFQIIDYFYDDVDKIGTFMDAITLIKQHFNSIKYEIMELNISQGVDIQGLGIGYDVVLLSNYKHFNLCNVK